MKGQARFLYPILDVARSVCPADMSIVALTDDPIANQLGNYYLYPRVIEVVAPDAPLDSDTIKSHAGGCIFYYLSGKEKLQHYSSRLEQQACFPAGCIYRIKP